MTNIQADIICIAEHNLAVDQSKTRFDLTNTIKRHLPNSRIVLTTSEISFPTAYKPGGCLQIITNSTNGRVTTQGVDRLGRWTYVGLATKNKSIIFIITLYKPCKHNQNSGPLTVYKQQWTMLRQQNIERLDPRQQFDNDLINFIEQLQQKSNRIIVVGDFNETQQRSKLFQTLQRMGLKDMIFSRHDNVPNIRSCNKGCNVIDHALCSSCLISSIQASMYEPFMLHTLSDHRGIIIDFDTKQLVGRQELITSPDKRGINSNNPAQVEKFLHHLQRYWRKYDITDRIKKAPRTASNQQELRAIVNHLDNDITKAMLQAEQKVRKATRPPWSPALKQASLLVKYYKLQRHQHLFKNDLSTAIQHTLHQMETTPKLPESTKEYQTLLRKAQKNLQKIRQNAQANRTQYLDILLQRYETLDDNKMKQVVKQIIRAEATKRCYRKLKWILKPPKPGVTFIERTTQDGATETLYDRESIETAILKRNQQHFNQCAGTPFTVGKLRKINWAADSDFADHILNGTVNQDSLPTDPYIRHVVTQCKQRSTEIDDRISTNDLRQLFKKWNEHTTTSPSGRHLGIYRAVFLSQYTKPQHHLDEDITALINILIRKGIGLNRWRKVTNMMIHKLEGSYNINKLRVIHLFEADYNGLLGILFNRRVLYQAEQNNILNNNQWGCRPHRQAEDALMLKELTYNMAITTKTTLATFDNDATGCFDRVPCTIAMLSSRRLGATKNICQLQADTLRHIEHKLRTAFGTSNSYYTSSFDREIHGQGQGSRAGPPTWVFVSSLLLDCMDQLANGLIFTCPKKDLFHQRTNDAFVDDVTGYSNNFLEELTGPPTINKVLQRMQEDATLWSRLLHISGGKLALHKCLYYIAAWRWNRGRASFVPATTILPTISLDNGQHKSAIQHYECTQAHRTLGQFKAPNGDNSTQLKHMQTKSHSWLSAIQEANLTRQEAHAAYAMIWFPSLSYGLGTTNLSYNELNQLQKPIINYILPALGYNRHLPRAVVFGSYKYGGLNMKHLYIDQGTKHVTQFLKYYRYGGSIGQLLKISLRWLHIVAGFSFCPLAKPQINYHHIEDKWYQSTIRFLYECNASIITNTRIQILCRVNDSCLMEDFLLAAPTAPEMKQLNLCRLYLRVIVLSDICECNGLTITRQCWEGIRPINTTQLWPNQAKPPSSHWTTWRKFLARCYLNDDDITRKKRQELQLAYPMGQWTTDHRPHRQHEYYINPISLTLYQTTNHPMQVYKPSRNSRTLLTFHPTGHATSLPQSLVPINPLASNERCITIHKQDLPPIPHRHIPTIHTFTDYIHTLEPWERQLLQHHNLHCTAEELLNRTTSNLTIASDGSVDNDRGSFGWVITFEHSILATGFGTAFGLTISSFRSEAYGILAALRFIYNIQLYHHLPLPYRSILWYCDSESLLKRIHNNRQDTHNPNRYKLADNDLEIAIVLTIPMVAVSFQQQHVRSHQYDNLPIQQLPLPHRLNRIADKLADQAHTLQPSNNNHVPLITLAGCQLQLKQGTITRSYTRLLQQAFMDSSTRQHICNRLNINRQTMDTIAWKEFARAFSSLSQGSQRIIRRWIFRYLPTQRRLARYKQSKSSLCPMCNTTEETDLHFLTCGGSNAWQTILLSPLEHLLHKHQANNHFASLLLANTKSFLADRAVTQQLQSDIGWQACFMGLFDQRWIELHNQTSKLQNGSTLITKTIKIFLSAVVTKWKDRCSYLHRTTTTTPTETRQRLQDKIRLLYTFKADVLPQDRQIFNLPLHDLLQRPNTSLQLFISQFQLMIKQSIRLQTEQTRRQHRDIATYFIRLR